MIHTRYSFDETSFGGGVSALHKGTSAPPQNTQKVVDFTTRNPSLRNETYVYLVYKRLARQQISISQQFPPSLPSRLFWPVYTSLSCPSPVAGRPPPCSPFRQWSAYPIPSTRIANDTLSRIALAWPVASREMDASRCLGATPRAWAGHQNLHGFPPATVPAVRLAPEKPAWRPLVWGSDSRRSTDPIRGAVLKSAGN
jgi:hypothetical protein